MQASAVIDRHQGAADGGVQKRVTEGSQELGRERAAAQRSRDETGRGVDHLGGRG